MVEQTSETSISRRGDLARREILRSGAMGTAAMLPLPAFATCGLSIVFTACTGNVHRFLPNYAARMWMKTADDGLAT